MRTNQEMVSWQADSEVMIKSNILTYFSIYVSSRSAAQVPHCPIWIPQKSFEEHPATWLEEASRLHLAECHRHLGHLLRKRHVFCYFSRSFRMFFSATRMSWAGFCAAQIHGALPLMPLICLTHGQKRSSILSSPTPCAQNQAIKQHSETDFLWSSQISTSLPAQQRSIAKCLCSVLSDTA